MKAFIALCLISSSVTAFAATESKMLSDIATDGVFSAMQKEMSKGQETALSSTQLHWSYECKGDICTLLDAETPVKFDSNISKEIEATGPSKGLLAIECANVDAAGDMDDCKSWVAADPSAAAKPQADFTKVSLKPLMVNFMIVEPHTAVSTSVISTFAKSAKQIGLRPPPKSMHVWGFENMNAEPGAVVFIKVDPTAASPRIYEMAQGNDVLVVSGLNQVGAGVQKLELYLRRLYGYSSVKCPIQPSYGSCD